MYKFSTYDEFREILRSYSRNHSNNYLLNSDIKKLINTGHLLYTQDDDALFLYERRDGYYKLFFQLNDFSAKLPPCDEPLMSYVVYIESNDNSDIKEWLMEQGFTLESQQIHIVTDKLTVDALSGDVSPATYEEAKELFSEYLVPFRMDLPLVEHCGSFLAIRGEDGTPLGVIHCGSPAFFTVGKSARRQNVAARLFAAYAAVNQSSTCKVWIDDGFYKPQGVYEKLGFIPDGLKCSCFMKI